MAIADIGTRENESVRTGNESIVIKRNLDSIRGGRTLDVSGYGPAVSNGVGTFGAITGGAGYVNGTYPNVALTGGTGTGARADITVSGGAVTSVVKVNPGTGYTAGDSLSAATADIGGGTGAGFAVVVASVTSVDKARVVHAGHLIIRETATKEYRPMPINAARDGYAALPAGHTYAGVLVADILTERPFAGIMTNGTVNPAASPFLPPAEALTALVNIQFRADAD